MVSSSIILAVGQFSAVSERMLTPLFVKSAPNGVPLTPEEPTTLTLALIGIGMIAAYVGVKRLLRPQRESRQMSLPPVHADVARIETHTRGAA